MLSIEPLLQVVRSKQTRRWIALAVLLFTAVLIVRFFVSHPEYLHQLRTVPPLVVVLILLLYGLMISTLVWVYDATLRLCGKRLAIVELAMLTAYSSILNFFGPLQSGPGVRAVYLKTQHQIRLRDYTLATLIYYGMLASCSAFFLLAGAQPWWQTLLGVIAAGGFSWFIINRFAHRRHQQTPEQTQFALRTGPLISLFLATLTQISLTAIIYFVELRAVNPAIQLHQAISYAGAAGFALFVSITPAAIGFREGFLVFSQQLHHVSTANILASSVIDRSTYIVFLVLLFGLTLAVHAKRKLHLNNWRQKTAKADE